MWSSVIKVDATLLWKLVTFYGLNLLSRRLDYKGLYSRASSSLFSGGMKFLG